MYQTCSSLFYLYCLDHSALIRIYNLMLLIISLLMQLRNVLDISIPSVLSVTVNTFQLY